MLVLVVVHGLDGHMLEGTGVETNSGLFAMYVSQSWLDTPHPILAHDMTRQASWSSLPDLHATCGRARSRRQAGCLSCQRCGSWHEDGARTINTIFAAGWVVCRTRRADMRRLVRINAEAGLAKAAEPQHTQSLLPVLRSTYAAVQHASAMAKMLLLPNAAGGDAGKCPRVRCILGRLERGWVNLRRNALSSALLGHIFVTLMLAKSVHASWGSGGRMVRSDIWMPACCCCVDACYSSTTAIWVHSVDSPPHLAPQRDQPVSVPASRSCRPAIRPAEYISASAARRPGLLQRQQT